MPQRVLNLCVTDAQRQAMRYAQEGLMEVDKLMRMYRSRNHMPKNGQGEVHGDWRRKINKQEEKVEQYLQWSRYRHEFYAHFLQQQVVRRRCK